MIRSGIFAAGNWIVDHTKVIDAWPAQDTLVNILSQTSANGGSPFNLLVDLAKLGAGFPLAGAGLIGADSDGDAVLAVCAEHGIDAGQIHRTELAATSYTDVMSVASTGRRTFFHQRGANALFGPEHVDLGASDAKIFHLGYLLLLDRFDAAGTRLATPAAELLADASAMGFETSIDVVSAEGARFAEIVLPALGYVDYCIMNELEAGRTAGVEIRNDADGSFNKAALESAGRQLIASGVRKWAVIHYPEGATAFAPDGTMVCGNSLLLGSNEIAGTTGAGDAFAAGFLFAMHDTGEIQQALEWGACAAAACLAHPTTSGGLQPMDKCLALRARR